MLRVTPASSQHSLEVLGSEGGRVSVAYTELFGAVCLGNEIQAFDVASEEFGEEVEVGSLEDMKQQDCIRVSISFDGAEIDYIEAAEFMQSIKRSLEDPDYLLL